MFKSRSKIIGPKTDCATVKNKQSMKINNFNRHFCDLGVIKRVYIFLGLLIQCFESTALFSFSWKTCNNKDKRTNEATKMKVPRNPNALRTIPLNMLLVPSDTNTIRSMIAILRRKKKKYIYIYIYSVSRFTLYYGYIFSFPFSLCFRCSTNKTIYN